MCALRRVHRDVSTPQEVDRSDGRCVGGRHADTGVQVDVDPSKGERTAKGHQESFDPLKDLGVVDRLDVQRELITTESGD